MNKEKLNLDLGTGWLTTLQLIFLTLKLNNLIDWSWWQVFIPLYIDIVLAIIAVLIYVFVIRKIEE